MHRLAGIEVPGRPTRGRRPGTLLVLIVLWGLFVAYGTMLPFDFSASRQRFESKRRAFFAHPLARASKADLASNVLLFLPWGGLSAAWLAGRGAGPLGATLAAAAGGAALSAAVEALQLFAPMRVSSWIDLATNTTGAALGALGGWPTARVVGPAIVPRLRRGVARRPLASLAIAAALMLLAANMAPFDISLDPGDLKAALKASRPIPFGPPLRGPSVPVEPWAWASEGLTWILVGGLFSLALREGARDRAPGRASAEAVALAGLLALAIEVASLAIRGQAADATVVVLRGAGAALGAAIVTAARRRDARAWIGPALLLWGLAMILARWTPPRFILRGWDDLSPGMFVPLYTTFYTSYRRPHLFELADVAVELVRYLPFGVLLAARSGRATARGAGLIGLGCGIVLEVGRFFEEGRTAEITPALSGAVGAASGVALWREGEAAWRGLDGPDEGRSTDRRPSEVEQL